MAETISPGNWQSMGSTLRDEHRFVTHLQPPTVTKINSLRRGNSVRLNRTGSQLGATSLMRQNSVKLTPKARFIRFLRRFDWKKRAQNSYSFGKKFLQRQPSFVITPDLSSFTYRFNNGDLTKRKPKARYNRGSQPVAAWKNSNPMQLLAGGGSNPPSVPAPSFPLHVGKAPSTLGARSGQQTRSNDEDLNPHSEPSHQDIHNSSSDEEKAARNWVRISLPLKPPKNQYSSHSREPSGDAIIEEEKTTPFLNLPDQETPNEKKEARDANMVPQEERSSNEYPPSAESRKTKRSSWLDQIPQTPVQSYTSHSDSNEKSASSKDQDKATSESQNSVARAYAVTATPPESPTALPSSYRPESWRKSAILTRNSAYPEYIDQPSSLDGLAESWSAYLRHTIAQRAVDSKKRMSREMDNEIRWSQNLAWDSEGESARSFISNHSGRRPESTSSGNSYSFGDGADELDFGRSNEDDGSHERELKPPTNSDKPEGNIPKTPELPSQPESPEFETTPINTAYAVTTHDSYVSPTLIRVTSPNRQSATRLAPLYSPRAMASASALAASSSNVALVPRQSDRGYAEDENDSGSSKQSPKTRVSREGLAPSLWNRESGSSNSLVDDNASTSSAASSSIFNEDEHIFPAHERSYIDEQDANVNKDDEDGSPHERGIVSGESFHAQRPSVTSDEFDFSNRSALKRPLPVSPVASPSQSTEALPSMRYDPIDTPVQSSTDVSQIPVPKHRNAKSMDSTSSDSSNGESAPAIVRSQSQWIQRSLSKQEGGYAARSRSVSGQKRLKSSGSKDYLLHSRQKTLESQWGDEDEGGADEEFEEEVDSEEVDSEGETRYL